MSRYSHLGQLFVAGEWRDGADGQTAPTTNPYTDETLLDVAQATESDVDDAYTAAAAAQEEWAGWLPTERQAVLAKAVEVMGDRHDEIIEWLVTESGSTHVKASAELGNAVGITTEAATFPLRMEGSLFPGTVAGKENRVYRVPVGVVGVISPWNFPFHLSMRSVAPALGAGNAVVLKPASNTPVTGGTLLGAIFEEAGVPPGLVGVVPGKGSEIGDAFVAHPAPRVISFTGSTPVGRGIAELAGKHLKRVELELGGNNLFVVLDDADLDQAARAAAFGKFLHQGQICIAINRIAVAASVHDAFVERFLDVVRQLQAGDPRDEATFVGPIIDDDQLESVLDVLQRTVDAGATVALGGEPEGRVVPPTVLTGVAQDMPAAEEEIFGPVAPVLSFETDDEALAIANATDYGLSGAVFTADIERGVAFARRVRTGMIHVNDMSVNDEPHVAFGGRGASGLGRFGGQWALDAFSTVQWVSVQHTPRDYPLPGVE
ncbi:aldehyde dehydrogenase family protein [Rubrivirga sp. S365]|uniref:aldehyde dehydrogenase family protein n=1 Tax=Rubrivirga sp. S365 TaxID=3076080 RepID=UPI0028C6A852|nr:aldehyde dehydrogenase family protein [Rubrivirga sp. S365]MDT7856607.1 aldehyde dehydrogenase family protein [Rubrivirga sp. S365]